MESVTFSSYCKFNAYVQLYLMLAPTPLNPESLGVTAMSLLRMDARTVWHLTWFMFICVLHEWTEKRKQEKKRGKKKEEKKKVKGGEEEEERTLLNRLHFN